MDADRQFGCVLSVPPSPVKSLHVPLPSALSFSHSPSHLHWSAPLFPSSLTPPPRMSQPSSPSSAKLHDSALPIGDDPPPLPPPPTGPSSTSTSSHPSPLSSPPRHCNPSPSSLSSSLTSPSLAPLPSHSSHPDAEALLHAMTSITSAHAYLSSLSPSAHPTHPSSPSTSPLTTSAPSIARLYSHVNPLLPSSHSDYDSFTPLWHPPSPYSVTHKLGRGKYSEVFAAIHESTSRPVVIKVLKPVKKRKIKREIHILQTLNGREGVVRLLDCVRDPATRYCSLVFELIEAVDFKEEFHRMGEKDVRRVMWQLIRTLDYAHSQGIMHRDVKPHNVLVEKEGGAVHLIDWGLAEFYHPGREYNVRVASRYFKSPELLVGFTYYDYSLDMWSVGCMLAGILFQTHPFFHGRDNVDQLCKIVKVRGTAPLLNYCEKYHIDLPSDIRHRIGDHSTKPWTRYITPSNAHLCTAEALDFLERLLQVDHQDRLTTQEALNHPYLLELTKAGGGKRAEEPPLPLQGVDVGEGKGEEEEQGSGDEREASDADSTHNGEAENEAGYPVGP